MQPQTLHRPVMDVAAPPKGPSPQPVAPAQTASVEQPQTPISVAPAPVPTPAPGISQAQTPLAVKAPPAPIETPAQAAAAMPLPKDNPKEVKKSTKPPKSNGSPTPVALITFTILAMLILAGLAVVVYVTSQSS